VRSDSGARCPWIIPQNKAALKGRQIRVRLGTIFESESRERKNEES
jgi:hypothetical protein